MYTIEGPEPLPPGSAEVTFDFAYDGGGLHKGATGTLSINGKTVAEGRIDRTMGAVYSLAGETADVGKDAWSPVTDDYDPWHNEFTGTINKITIRLHDSHADPDTHARGGAVAGAGGGHSDAST